MARIDEHAGSHCRACNVAGAKIHLYDNAVFQAELVTSHQRRQTVKMDS
jgi:hypothetical protein